MASTPFKPTLSRTLVCVLVMVLLYLGFSWYHQPPTVHGAGNLSRIGQLYFAAAGDDGVSYLELLRDSRPERLVPRLVLITCGVSGLFVSLLSNKFQEAFLKSGTLSAGFAALRGEATGSAVACLVVVSLFALAIRPNKPITLALQANHPEK